MRDRWLAPIASAARTYSRVVVLDVFGAHQAVDAGPAGQAEDQHDRADAAAEAPPRTRRSAGCPGIEVKTL